MNTAESINRILSVAASLLDRAASEVRDGKLEPVRGNIERLSKALAEVMEVQLEVYKVQPELAPKYLTQNTEHSAANRLLTQYMYNASEFELAGNTVQAIATFQEFLALESSPVHRSIAVGEIERLKSEEGT
jgi:hypothetical protein